MTGLELAHDAIARACTLDGCGRSWYCGAYCTMHYNRVKKNGHPGDIGRQKAEWGAGFVTNEGYRGLSLPGHPLADRRGRVLEHRLVLFRAIGPGAHPCQWCGKTVIWRGKPPLVVDHLDFNRTNNVRSNLVPSCIACNCRRLP